MLRPLGGLRFLGRRTYATPVLVTKLLRVETPGQAPCGRRR
eukprot:COSAG01_NODE_73973_length_231_cov_69.386364_1_plen_40_part_01